MRLVLALMLVFVPTAVLAHPGHGATSGPLHGFEHPFGSLENLLALGLVAVVVAGGVLLLGRVARKDRGKP